MPHGFVLYLLIAATLVAGACGQDPGAVLNLQGSKAVTAFFLLGFLREFPDGRLIVEGGDTIERFSCDERRPIALFAKYLKVFASEQGVPEAVMKREPDGCSVAFRSQPLSRFLNSLYNEHLGEDTVRLSFGRTRRITRASLDDRVLREANSQAVLAYLAGAHARYSKGDSFVFAGHPRKAETIRSLLERQGCTDIRLSTDSKPVIPGATTITFVPSEQVREVLSINRW